MSATRSARFAQIQALVADGLTHREIAERIGLSLSTVRNYLYDPDGSKIAARRERYAGTCVDCGAATNGNGGPGTAAERCDSCYRLSIRPEHGTLSRYQGGCSCDACRRANAAHIRSLKGKPPPSHSYSGYTNYGCRCLVCTRAHSDYLWRRCRGKRGRAA